jgi:hypothetical protein
MKNRDRKMALALVLLPIASAERARADGGTLQLAESVGPYRLAIFTAPTVLRAGPMDVSVLVQDGKSGALIPDAVVEMSLRAEDGVGTPLRILATHEAASNKLFQAALFDVPRAGRWHAEITVDGPEGRAQTEFDFEVGPAPPTWLEMSLWIGWPVVPLGLFIVHQVLVRRATCQRACTTST